MIQAISKNKVLSLTREAGDLFKACSRKGKILSALSWGPEVSQSFLQKKGTALPTPQYNVDRKTITELIEALEKFKAKTAGAHPVLLWLERTRLSFHQGLQLLLEIEKPSFYQISSELYGNSQTKLFNGDMKNIELSRALSQRMSTCALNDIAESRDRKSADEFCLALEDRLRNRYPMIPVKVEVTDQIVAKVVAGMNRVRIRKDARFADGELEALWSHEIESHCLTAHNGSLHDEVDFLMSAGPRTTMTQEGLAVFYEVYSHSMSQVRFLALCDRIEAVQKVEDGADFIELYRWYKGRTDSDREAFYQSQRIFRGAVLTGGAPFTKDVVYLAGLLGVYNFLRIAVKNQNRILVETLVGGRMALEDVGTLAWMRAHGILKPPYFIPDWLKNWEGLLSFFSLTAVFGALDLTGFQSYFDEHYTLEDWDLSV